MLVRRLSRNTRFNSRIITASRESKVLFNKQSFGTNRFLSQFVQEDVDTTAASLSSSDINTQLFNTISAKPFDEKAVSVLLEKVDENEVEIKPDGIIYLPEIKYRRILNRAFGPGGWGLMPRGNYIIEKGFVCQQYALFCNGQFVSMAWGEQTFSSDGAEAKLGRSLATALEGAKSNALMRCCKDLGIASDLWDPSFIIDWKSRHSVEVWATHSKTGIKKKLYRRKDRPPFEYPYIEEKSKSRQAARAPVATPLNITTPDDTSSSIDDLPDEEVDVNMFDSFDITDSSDQTSAPIRNNKSAATQLDLNETIKFGKFVGKKWSEVIDTPEFASYVSWMMKNKPTSQIKQANEILNARKQQE